MDGDIRTLEATTTTKILKAGSTLLRLDTNISPVLTRISFEPALPGRAAAKLKLNSTSVAAEDMLAVPDWTIPKHPIGRLIQEMMEASPAGPQPFVDQCRFDLVLLELSEPMDKDVTVVLSGYNVRLHRDGTSSLMFSQ
jgi:hypothetical protein